MSPQICVSTPIVRCTDGSDSPSIFVTVSVVCGNPAGTYKTYIRQGGQGGAGKVRVGNNGDQNQEGLNILPGCRASVASVWYTQPNKAVSKERGTDESLIAQEHRRNVDSRLRTSRRTPTAGGLRRRRLRNILSENLHTRACLSNKTENNMFAWTTPTCPHLPSPTLTYPHLPSPTLTCPGSRTISNRVPSFPSPMMSSSNESTSAPLPLAIGSALGFALGGGGENTRQRFRPCQAKMNVFRKHPQKITRKNVFLVTK